MSAVLKALAHFAFLWGVVLLICWLTDIHTSGVAVAVAVGFAALIRTYEQRGEV